MIRYKIHALEEIKGKKNVEFYTLSAVIGEMEALSKNNKKVKKEVAIAKQILENNDVRVIESKMENVDNELVEKSKDFVIATNDKELRKRVREKRGKSIYIKKLALVEMREISN
jgi:rRNA-processing protein FCF1